MPRSIAPDFRRGQVTGQAARVRSIQDRMYDTHWAEDGTGDKNWKFVLLGCK